MWETKRKLREELDNAEQRVVFHFKRANTAERQLKNIERTIQIEESNKTPAIFIVEKIKELVKNCESNN